MPTIAEQMEGLNQSQAEIDAAEEQVRQQRQQVQRYKQQAQSISVPQRDIGFQFHTIQGNRQLAGRTEQVVSERQRVKQKAISEADVALGQLQTYEQNVLLPAQEQVNAARQEIEYYNLAQSAVDAGGNAVAGLPEGAKKYAIQIATGQQANIAYSKQIGEFKVQGFNPSFGLTPVLNASGQKVGDTYGITGFVDANRNTSISASGFGQYTELNNPALHTSLINMGFLSPLPNNQQTNINVKDLSQQIISGKQSSVMIQAPINNATSINQTSSNANLVYNGTNMKDIMGALQKGNSQIYSPINMTSVIGGVVSAGKYIENKAVGVYETAKGWAGSIQRVVAGGIQTQAATPDLFSRLNKNYNQTGSADYFNQTMTRVNQQVSNTDLARAAGVSIVAPLSGLAIAGGVTVSSASTAYALTSNAGKIGSIIFPGAGQTKEQTIENFGGTVIDVGLSSLGSGIVTGVVYKGAETLFTNILESKVAKNVAEFAISSYFKKGLYGGGLDIASSLEQGNVQSAAIGGAGFAGSLIGWNLGQGIGNFYINPRGEGKVQTEKAPRVAVQNQPLMQQIGHSDEIDYSFRGVFRQEERITLTQEQTEKIIQGVKSEQLLDQLYKGLSVPDKRSLPQESAFSNPELSKQMFSYDNKNIVVSGSAAVFSREDVRQSIFDLGINRQIGDIDTSVNKYNPKISELSINENTESTFIDFGRSEFEISRDLKEAKFDLVKAKKGILILSTDADFREKEGEWKIDSKEIAEAQSRVDKLEAELKSKKTGRNSIIESNGETPSSLKAKGQLIGTKNFYSLFNAEKAKEYTQPLLSAGKELYVTNEQIQSAKWMEDIHKTGLINAQGGKLKGTARDILFYNTLHSGGLISNELFTKLMKKGTPEEKTIIGKDVDFEAYSGRQYNKMTKSIMSSVVSEYGSKFGFVERKLSSNPSGRYQVESDTLGAFKEIDTGKTYQYGASFVVKSKEITPTSTGMKVTNVKVSPEEYVNAAPDIFIMDLPNSAKASIKGETLFGDYTLGSAKGEPIGRIRIAKDLTSKERQETISHEYIHHITPNFLYDIEYQVGLPYHMRPSELLAFGFENVIKNKFTLPKETEQFKITKGEETVAQFELNRPSEFKLFRVVDVANKEAASVALKAGKKAEAEPYPIDVSIGTKLERLKSYLKSGRDIPVYDELGNKRFSLQKPSSRFYDQVEGMINNIDITKVEKKGGKVAEDISLGLVNLNRDVKVTAKRADALSAETTLNILGQGKDVFLIKEGARQVIYEKAKEEGGQPIKGGEFFNKEDFPVPYKSKPVKVETPQGDIYFQGRFGSNIQNVFATEIRGEGLEPSANKDLLLQIGIRSAQFKLLKEKINEEKNPFIKQRAIGIYNRAVELALQNEGRMPVDYVKTNIFGLEAERLIPKSSNEILNYEPINPNEQLQPVNPKSNLKGNSFNFEQVKNELNRQIKYRGGEKVSSKTYTKAADILKNTLPGKSEFSLAESNKAIGNALNNVNPDLLSSSSSSSKSIQSNIESGKYGYSNYKSNILTETPYTFYSNYKYNKGYYSDGYSNYNKPYTNYNNYNSTSIIPSLTYSNGNYSTYTFNYGNTPYTPYKPYNPKPPSYPYNYYPTSEKKNKDSFSPSNFFSRRKPKKYKIPKEPVKYTPSFGASALGIRLSGRVPKVGKSGLRPGIRGTLGVKQLARINQSESRFGFSKGLKRKKVLI